MVYLGDGNVAVDLYFDPVRQLPASGWYEPYVTDGYHDPSNTNFSIGISDGDYRNFLAFDLSGLSGAVSSATLTMRNDFLHAHDLSRCQDPGSGTLTLYAIDTALRELLDGGSEEIWVDLGSGTVYASLVVEDAMAEQISVPLNADALAAIQARVGSGVFTVGGTYDPVWEINPYGHLFGCSDGAAPGAALLVLSTGEPTHALTVKRRGNGSGTVAMTANGAPLGWASCTATECTAYVPADAEVVLTATPDAGMRFVRWGQACSSAATTCSFQMDAAKRILAVFGSRGSQRGP